MNFKHVKITVLALALALASGAILPKKSHAYLALGGAQEWASWWDNNGPLGNTFFIGLCAITLPACLLDQEGSDVQISHQSLLEQGYSEAEIKALTREQNTLSKMLMKNGYRLEVRPTDTRSSLTQEILSVSPETSEQYLDFFFEIKGIQ